MVLVWGVLEENGKVSWYAWELNPHLLLQEADNKSSISMPFKNIKRRCQNGGNMIEEDIRILRRGKHQGWLSGSTY